MTRSDTVKTVAIIPVRLSSTRLPNKPLADIAGKTLVQRVWEQAQRVRGLTAVYIATEDDQIEHDAARYGAKVIRTSTAPRTGTDRVAEALEKLAARGEQYDLVANIQGDMPFINPLVVEHTIATLAEAPETISMSTLAAPILDQSEFARPSAVKVVIGVNGRALYFSRAPIPHYRDGAPTDTGSTIEKPFGHKHIGLYVFRTAAIAAIAALPSAPLEEIEKLEQLRALSHGVQIAVYVAAPELLRQQIEVDTPEDLRRANEIARQ